jgi:tetratricopeptide (TPR) repeat protein
MSETPTSLRPSALPEAVHPRDPIALGAPSHSPPAHASTSTSPPDGTVAKLRAELAAVTDRPRQARLLGEIGELEERAGDEPGAARDYLAAFNADPLFREPLEGLVRLLERRRSLRNLGKLIDALVRAAATPEEKARALLMKAAFAEDVSTDLDGAMAAAREAVATGAEGPETSLAWLTIEVLAAKLDDPPLRMQALAERAKCSRDPTWKGLLLLDSGRVAGSSGAVDHALEMFAEARNLQAGASYPSTVLTGRLVRSDHGAPGSPEAKARAHAYAVALEAQADLIYFAIGDSKEGDALGVPRSVRDVAHLVDAWMRAGEAHRATGELAAAATVLERAERALGDRIEPSGPVETALTNARLRVAEGMGELGAAARLAEKRLEREEDPGVAAALIMRVAAEALASGDTKRALEVLGRAIAKDPTCVPARAYQLDLLADGDDPAAFASELETYAEHLETDEARGRTFLLAAFVWGLLAGDAASARAAISQAGLYGVPPGTLSRLSRSMAFYRQDTAWHDEATRRLLANGADSSELRTLWFELVRERFARGDGEGAVKALRELGGSPKGAWLAHALEAYLPLHPALAERRGLAVEELASSETDPGRARGVALAAAARSHHGGDIEKTRESLLALAEAHPKSALVASYLADLERSAGVPSAAARAASRCAEVTDDVELGAALFLEAGFDAWRAGDRGAAVASFERSAQGAPRAARSALAWSAWGLDTETFDGRRRALQRAVEAGDDVHVIALDAFALELAAGDSEAAVRALDTIEEEADGHLLIAGDLARIGWEEGASNLEALRAAIGRIGALGERAHAIAAAEQLRLAENADPAAVADAARAWFDAGGGIAAALEWLGATMGTPAELEARRMTASLFTGSAREAMLASASLFEFALHPSPENVHFVEGETVAVRLANLELAPPGSDPHKRAEALVALDGALGADLEVDALALAGWSLLATSDIEAAARAFGSATQARPDDLAPWIGLHAAAEATGDRVTRASAAERIGALSCDGARGAMYWEEAALILLELGEGDHAEEALQACFDRDPSRGVAFDKLFRRVREKKEGDRLLDLIEKRLGVTDDPTEIVKLYWERARVLREKGDTDGALLALENVTLIEPDHVGALALSGEIFIRKGRYEEAAEALGRLAKIEAAPPKNRVTAGIAAVDLYENKLNRFDLALDVLLALHRAKLTTLAVRERLARAAARAGAWREAAHILEELMNDRPTPEGRVEAAQLAMAIHRDRLGDANGALPSIIKVLKESPANGDAIDLLLVTDREPEARMNLLAASRGAIVKSLTDAPLGGVVVERLAHVAAALKDDALEHTALAAAVALGAGGSAGRLRMAQLASGAPRFPQTALSASMHKALLSPGDEGPFSELFLVLGPTLAEALGPTLATAGVSKRDRVDARSGLPLRNEIAAWAGAFGVQEFELYVGGKDPMAIQGVPGEPGAIVVGPGVNSPLPVAKRARVARELFAMSRGTTIVGLRDETTVAAVVVAASKLAEVRIDSPPYAVQGEIDKLLSKALARKTRKLLPEIFARIVSSRADARAWARAARASQDRVASLACGDVGVVLSETLGQPPDQVPAHVTGDVRAEEVLRFVLSSEYLGLRRSLGLEEAP